MLRRNTIDEIIYIITKWKWARETKFSFFSKSRYSRVMHRVTISRSRSEKSNRKMSYKRIRSRELLRSRKKKNKCKILLCNWIRSISCASLHTDSISFVRKGTVETAEGGERETKKKRKKQNGTTKRDDQILDDFSRRRISLLAPIIKTLETEEVEERKWKVKWLESGLISMQNARLVRGARVVPCATLSHLYPTGSHAGFNHLTLSELCHHPSPPSLLSLP